MSGVILRWVDEIRGSARAKTTAAIEALEREIAEIEESLASCGDPEAFKASRLDLEAEIRRMEKEQDDLQKRLAAAEEENARQRRSAAAEELGAVAALLAAHRFQCDCETLRAASDFLGPRNDLIRKSPEELRHLLEGDRRIAVVRARLGHAFQDAHAEANRQKQFVEQARTLESQIETLEREIRDLRRGLAMGHDVAPVVLEAIEAMAPDQAARLRSEFLDPKRNDAQLEDQWGLPDDVIGVIAGRSR